MRTFEDYTVYNVIIVGGGISGLMTAYRLVEQGENDILIIEKGKPLTERFCPISKTHGSCMGCPTCSITSGIAGSGAFSDGKFNIGTNYGGTLAEKFNEELANNYIKMVDKALVNIAKKNNITIPEIYYSDSGLSLKCIQNNLKLLDMNVRHWGTDGNFKLMNALVSYLIEKGVTIQTKETVTYVTQDYGMNELHSDKNKYLADALILATGRGGSSFIRNVCKELKIEIESNKVDIGVRVEMPDIIWKEFSDKIYEPKILYKTNTFEDSCRMFCFNQGGLVSAENNNGIITANGHSFSNSLNKTKNCNFAILSSINFTEPFDQPTEYVENIAKLANAIGDGNILVQRYGDLKRGRRTNAHRLSKCSFTPTLKATPGDLSLVLPYRILKNITETIEALNSVAPGTSNDDTLLYGVEAKYYSVKPVNNEFEIANDMYLIGDGSGITRGLSQAGATGFIVADKILKTFKS